MWSFQPKVLQTPSCEYQLVIIHREKVIYLVISTVSSINLDYLKNAFTQLFSRFMFAFET